MEVIYVVCNASWDTMATVEVSATDFLSVDSSSFELGYFKHDSVEIKLN